MAVETPIADRNTEPGQGSRANPLAEQPLTGAANATPTAVLLPKLNVRDEERIPYPWWQAIAPYTGDRQPSRGDFVPVQCRDFSQHGFSFICDLPPTYPQLVVELGTRPKLIYITAEVMNCSFEDHDGQRRFRIGCRFLRRINY